MSDIDAVIYQEQYEGIRDQDGWDTLELTVFTNHTHEEAEAIMIRLEEKQYE